MDAWETAMNLAFGYGGVGSTTYQTPTSSYNPPPVYQPQQMATRTLANPNVSTDDAAYILDPNMQGLPRMTNFMSVYRGPNTQTGLPTTTNGVTPAPTGGPFYGEPAGMGRTTQIDMGYSNPPQSYQMPGGTNPSQNPYGLLGGGPRPSTPAQSPYGGLSPQSPPSPAYGGLPMRSTPMPPPSPFGDLSGVPNISNRYAQPAGAGVRMPAGPSPYGSLSPQAPPSPVYGGLPTRSTQMPPPANPYGSLSPQAPPSPVYGGVVRGNPYGALPTPPTLGQKYTDRVTQPAGGASYGANAPVSASSGYTSRYGTATPAGLLGGTASSAGAAR